MSKPILIKSIEEDGNIFLKHFFMPVAQDLSELLYLFEGDSIHSLNTDVINAVKSLFSSICDRRVSTDKQVFDDKFYTLSMLEYSDRPNGKQNGGKRIVFTSNDLCVFFANLCNKLAIYWDEAEHTAQELDYFKNTLFGHALWEFECFTSQQDKKNNAQKSSVSKSISSANTKTTSTNKASDKWKAQGPLSPNVRDLVGQPLQKLSVVGSQSYKLVNVNLSVQKGKEVRAYVKPLSAKGEVNGTNKVFIGYGSNYGDFVCYWDAMQDAQDFLQALKERFPNSQEVQGLTITIEKSKKNGYYIVGTELGINCVILAKGLNEQILEDNCTNDTLNKESKFKNRHEYEEALVPVYEKLSDMLR